MSLSYLSANTPTAEGKVAFHIGGVDYFKRIAAAIDDLQSGDKLYLMNWHIATDFQFRPDALADDPEPGLGAKLMLAVKRGVDVRVLLWVNTNLFEPLYPVEHNPGFVSDLENLFEDVADVEERLTGQRRLVPGFEDTVRAGALRFGNAVRRNNALPFKDIMLRNIVTAHIWRTFEVPGQGPLMRDRILINTLDSAFGGCHAKFALIVRQGSDGMRGIAYTGGIDFASNRFADPPYHPWDAANPAVGQPEIDYWHDIMASTEGVDAVRPLFNFFQTLWNENVQRKDNFNPQVTAHIEVPAQINEVTLKLDCVPAAASLIENLNWDNGDQYDTHLVQSLSTIPNTFQLFGTPDNPGIGEPALSAYPDGNFNLRETVRKAIAEAQHYIYVEDQAIQSLELYELVVDALKARPALVVILVRGGDPADADDNDDHTDEKVIRAFQIERLTDVERQRLLLFEGNYTIHSKLFLIDDAVAVVGSAGFFTRSMTEEIEHSIALIDHNSDGATADLADLRKRLWQIHTGIDFKQAQYDDLAAALAVWRDPTAEFGPSANGCTLVRYEWDSHVFMPFPDNWQHFPGLMAKKHLSDEELTDEEALDLFIFEEYLTERGQLVAHMLMYEVPFSSWFNPSTMPPNTVLPNLQRSQTAVNQPTRLSLSGSGTQTIEWLYLPADGLGADDAAPATGSGEVFNVQFRSPGIKTVVATVTGDTPGIEQKIPFVLHVLENSGDHWVARYPTSKSLDTLADGFREAIIAFLQALQAAGLSNLDLDLLATYRPPERAYLMASCYQISQKGTAPAKIKHELAHVPISWVHFGVDGNADEAASRAAALAMFQAYGIGSSGAVYPSNHMKGTAVDMKIRVAAPMDVLDKEGNTIEVKGIVGLVKVARTYGVRHLRDSNHWSLTGG